MIADQLFGTTGHVTLIQECARSVLIFGFGLLLVRISGRRAFARWSALDIVVAIMVGSSLSRALTGNAPLFGTMVSSALMMLLHWVFARASAVSRSVSKLIEGPAVRLASDGTVHRQAMLSHNVTEADLHEALRQARFTDLPEGASVVLEPSGRISVLASSLPRHNDEPPLR